jgi:hypothetical protein
MGFLLWQSQLLSELWIGFLQETIEGLWKKIHSKSDKRQREQGPGVYMCIGGCGGRERWPKYRPGRSDGQGVEHRHGYPK